MFNEIVKDRKIYIYNAQFDTGKILSVCRLHKLPLPRLKTSCVMLKYAYLYDDYHDYFDDYTWQKLTDAIEQQNIDISGIGASHRALADCQMTRLLANKIAKNQIITIDGYTQEQRRANEAQEVERRKREREERLARQVKYRKSVAKKSALIPKNWSEFPYFGMSRPPGYKTFSKLRVKDFPYYEYAGTCCSTYGDQGHLFKPKQKEEIKRKSPEKI